MGYTILFLIGSHMCIFAMSIGGGILLSLTDFIIRALMLYARYGDEENMFKIFKIVLVNVGIPQIASGLALFIGSVIIYVIMRVKMRDNADSKLLTGHHLVALVSSIMFALTFAQIFMCNGARGNYPFYGNVYFSFEYTDAFIYNSFSGCYFSLIYSYIGVSLYPVFCLIQLIIMIADIAKNIPNNAAAENYGAVIDSADNDEL